MKDALKKLEREEFDAIISDYQMPEIDGLEFLEILRKEKNSDIPFIMFTGKGREEVAIEALNLEANRYLQKGGDPKSQYSLLAETVKQEIERKRSEEEVDRLSSMVRNSSEAIICTDKDFRITFVNRSAEEMFGYKAKELEKETLTMLNAEGEKDKIQNKMFGKLSSGETYKNIHLNERKDGSVFYCEMKVSPIKDDEGNINGYVSSQRDITHRKEAEQRAGHLNSLLRAIRNVNQIIVQGKSIENIMQNACDFFVSTRSYLECTIALLDDESQLINPIAVSGLNKLDEDWSLNLEDEGVAPSCIKKVVKEGKIDIRNTKDCISCDFKEEREHHTSLTVPMKRHDSVVGIIHIGFNEFVEVDEEEIQLIEEVADDLAFARDKLLSERDLKETKDRLELALDASDHGFWDWDLDTDEVYFNPKFYEMLGYEEGELSNLYETWKELMHPDDKKEMIPKILEHIENAEPFEKEFRLKTKSGVWKWISARGKTFELDDEGNPHRAVGTHVDIDERKRKEEVIKDSQRRYKSIFEESPNALWEEDYSEVKKMIDEKKKDVDDLEQYLDHNPEFIKNCIKNVKVIDFNKQVLEMYDADDREEYLDNLDEVFTEKSLEIFKKTLIKIANGETYIEGEDINQTLTGDKIDVFVTWKVVPGHEEDYSRVYVSDSDITDRKNVERKLKRSEEKFRTFTRKAPVPVFIHQNEICIYANDAAENLLGYDKEDILGKEIWEFIHPQSRDKVRERRDKRRNGEDVKPTEGFKINSKNGEKYVKMMVEPIEQMEDDAYAVVAIDKTEEKEYQEKIEHQAELLDKVGQAVIVTDKNGEIEFWNQRAEELYGWDSDEVIGKNIMEVTPSLHSKENAEKIMKKLKKGETWTGEFSVKDKEGNEFQALVSDKPIMNDDGKLESIIGITTDISDLKEKEDELKKNIEKRKELEEKLRESKDRYQSLFNHSPDGILLIDKEGDIVESNDRAYEQLNYTEEEFSKINISDIEAEESKKEINDHIDKIMSEDFDTFETLHETKDGTIKNTKVIAQMIDIEGEEYVHTIFRDITERKETFKRLKKSKRFLQKSIDSIPANICILDEKGEIIKINQRWKEFAESEELGWNDHGIGHNYLNISKESEGMASEGSDKVYMGIKSIINGEKELFKHEYPCHSPDEKRWFLLTASSFDIGEETKVIISHTNITERKLAENKLRENRSRLKRSQEIANVGSWELDLDTNELKWSEQTYEIFGVGKDEPMNYDQFLKAIHPEDREYVDRKWHKALETGDYDIEHRIVVNEETKWVREKADIRFEDKGDPVEAVGSVQDITEKKKIRDKLHQNKDELETILESVPAMIWYKDTENNFIRVNRAAAEVTGYSPEEMEGRSVKEFYPETADDYYNNDLEVIESGKPKLGIIEKMETRYDGTKWVITDKVPYRDEKGNVIGVIVLSVDITKRKEYEEKLIRSKEEYKNLIESMNDAVFIHDLDGNFLTVNQTTVDRLGYSKDKLLSMNPKDIDAPNFRKKVEERMKKIEEDHELVFESKHITKKGNEIPVEINASLITYQDEPAVLSIARDITDRKEAEDKLKNSERRFRKTFEASPDPTFLLDENGLLKEVNNAVEEILGFDKGEIIGDHICKAPFMSEKAADKKIEKFEKRKKGENISPYNIELKDKNGNSIFAEINVSAFQGDGFEGEILIARDITDRKQAEERFR
ncbi:MAG: PAS domain S-box protein, partial [Thermoplasmatota archaeon]